MSVQQPDFLRYKRKTFIICGYSKNGKDLFHPVSYGLEAVPFSTTCWRGHFCEYKIFDDKLFLRNFWVGLPNETDEEGWSGKVKYPPIVAGKFPKWSRTEDCYFYKGVDIFVRYDGGFLLGNNFYDGERINYAVNPAFNFANLFEAIFKDGKLISFENRSLELEKLRQKIVDSNLEADSFENFKKVQRWFSKNFTFNY